MNRSDWIGIAAIAIAGIFSSIQILLQRSSMRRAPAQSSQAQGNQRIPRNLKFEWRLPKWVLRVAIFVIQSVAVYILIQEYRSTEPLTRASALMIASMAAVVAICFVVPLIFGVYRNLEAYTVGPDA